jgi:hypothetical protein
LLKPKKEFMAECRAAEIKKRQGLREKAKSVAVKALQAHATADASSASL